MCERPKQRAGDGEEQVAAGSGQRAGENRSQKKVGSRRRDEACPKRRTEDEAVSRKPETVNREPRTENLEPATPNMEVSAMADTVWIFGKDT